MQAIEHLKKVQVIAMRINNTELADEICHGIDEALAELQQLKSESCPDDCKYNRFGSDSLGYATDCTIMKHCKRIVSDHYTPKGE
jgi:hypothetical protein